MVSGLRFEACCCLSVVHVFRIWVVAGGAAFVFEKKRRSGLQLQACAAAPPATGGGGPQFIDVSKYSSECDRSRKMKGAGGCTRCGGAQLCVFPCETGAASLLAMTSNCMQTLAPPPSFPFESANSRSNAPAAHHRCNCMRHCLQRHAAAVTSKAHAVNCSQNAGPPPPAARLATAAAFSLESRTRCMAPTCRQRHTQLCPRILAHTPPHFLQLPP